MFIRQKSGAVMECGEMKPTPPAPGQQPAAPALGNVLPVEELAAPVEELAAPSVELTAQAPSGYNLQPWRFIVVRDPQNRKRLQKAAMDQPKVGEAPVVIIAIGMKEETKTIIEDVLQEGAERGAGKPEAVAEMAAQARKFLDSFPMDVWVNRHTMIAVTTMMLVAETFGFDTAPMEGFNPAAVKRDFGIPDEAEVVALLAIGHRLEPDKPYPGRFPLSRIVSHERYGTPWEDSFEIPD